MLMDIQPLELARQMALYDHKLLRKIRLGQLLNKLWERDKVAAKELIEFGQRMELVKSMLILSESSGDLLGSF